MNKFRNKTISVLFAAACLTAAAVGQETTKTENIPGQATSEEMVRSGEVVMAVGNDLYVKMEDGTVKHFSVPADARFTIDGKEVTTSELTPGTKLTQTIKTTRTPEVVRTTTNLKGKVWHVSPPSTIILTLADGSNKQYKIPKGQKFEVDGQMVDAFSLRKGMNLNATVTREVPEESVSEDRQVVGQAPAEAAPAEPVAQAQPEATPQPPAEAEKPAEPAPAQLPETASSLPLISLVGVLSILSAITMKRSKKRF